MPPRAHENIYIAIRDSLICGSTNRLESHLVQQWNECRIVMWLYCIYKLLQNTKIHISTSVGFPNFYIFIPNQEMLVYMSENWRCFNVYGLRLGLAWVWQGHNVLELHRIWFFQIRPGPELAGFRIAGPAGAGAGAECSWAGGLGYIT